MSRDDALRQENGTRPQRLGLLAHGFVTWGGGLDFLRGIATGLQHANPSVELHVLAPVRGSLLKARKLRDTARRALGIPTMSAHQPAPEHLERALAHTGAIVHRIDIGPRAQARTASRLQLDALLPAIVPQSTDKWPWVGYIFDFQHKHLPHFFSEEERARRDLEFGRMLDSASAVIVNAKDVLKDIDDFYPHRRAKVFTLPFSPAPEADWFSASVNDVAVRYKIGGPYFIICNQFWKHKDHGTAFKAFAAIGGRHPNLKLVCTGPTIDFRFPEHFSELMRQAARDGIADRILPLGLIPKADQLALLRGAVALVQPTLFEGGPGGGAVFDAVALGVRALVSDIDVNREIDELTVTFFKAGDATVLAECMETILAEPQPTAADATELITRGVRRRRACGEVLLQAIEQAMTDHRPRFFQAQRSASALIRFLPW